MICDLKSEVTDPVSGGQSGLPCFLREDDVTRPLASLLLAAATLAIMWCALESSGGIARAEVLEASPTLRWYKGNTHTHSHWSDGDDYLEMIALWYRERGYDFLVFSDHNVLPTSERWIDVAKSKGGRAAYDKLKARFPDWVEERMAGEQRDRLEVRLRTFDEVIDKVGLPGEFLLIQGEEISDKFHTHPVHLGAGNVQEVILPRGGNSVTETIQNNVDAVLTQREKTGQAMFVHLNHPNFHYGITAEDLAPVVGEQFFEVYNGHPGVNNSGDEQHAGTERIWDIVLTRRLAELGLPVMYGLATDDGHAYHKIPSRASEPGRGWIQVLANRLDPESLIPAMEAGRFYASSGVTLKRVESTAQGLTVEVEPVAGETYTIEFIGTRKGYDAASEAVKDKDGKEVRATRRYSPSIGETFATIEGPQATYQFHGDEIYVRARVTSSEAHPNPSEPGEPQRAWVQPATRPGSP
jgi:hypothetical protein